MKYLLAEIRTFASIRSLVLLLACLAYQAFAVPSYDPFADASGSGGTSYAVGSTLVGQYNSFLFGPWYVRGTNAGLTQPVIIAGNLSYPGLPASTGNSVSFVPANAANACIDLNVPIGHSETVYYSFLLKITDLSAVSTSPTNNPIVAYLDDPSLTFPGNQVARLGSRLLTKKVGAGYVLGIGRAPGPPGSSMNRTPRPTILGTSCSSSGVTNASPGSRRMWISGSIRRPQVSGPVSLRLPRSSRRYLPLLPERSTTTAQGICHSVPVPRRAGRRHRRRARRDQRLGIRHRALSENPARSRQPGPAAGT